jgi:hypothetical protein
VVEGATSLGSTTVAADGSWTFNVGKVTDVDHTFTLSEAADLAGNVSTSPEPVFQMRMPGSPGQHRAGEAEVIMLVQTRGAFHRKAPNV